MKHSTPKATLFGKEIEEAMFFVCLNEQCNHRGMIICEVNGTVTPIGLVFYKDKIYHTGEPRMWLEHRMVEQ